MVKKSAFSLDGAICVITGASSGLGRQFALDFATNGATVVGLARRSDLLKSLQSDLSQRQPHTRSKTVVCDVSDIDSFISVLESIDNEFGRIDVLVNCAGIGEPKDAKDTDDLTRALVGYRSVMETNYFAAVASTLYALQGMGKRGNGVIVNVSSDSARAPGPGEPAYCASKAALSAFTESLALSLDGSGLHFHVLYPGWVPTAMGTGAIDDGMSMPPKFVRRSEEQVSQLLISRIGMSRIDIDAAPIARFAPVARALAPNAYKKGVIASS
ncbi:MAG: SDR family oxidoreductase [Acidimicrobiales bacterium]